MLSVGALEETVTVSGEAPVVDVQSISQAEVLDREVLDAIPTGRNLLKLLEKNLAPCFTRGR